LRVAVAVTGWPRKGAGRLRAVAQGAGRVGPGQRSAAGADGEDLDGRKADRIAELDVPILGDARLSFIGQRDVGRGAAHVEADRIGKTTEAGDVAAGDGAGSDSGTGKARSEILDACRRHNAAASVQQQEIAGIALICETIAEPARVTDHDR